jgi:hypothetical protein
LEAIFADPTEEIIPENPLNRDLRFDDGTGVKLKEGVVMAWSETRNLLSPALLPAHPPALRCEVIELLRKGGAGESPDEIIFFQGLKPASGALLVGV